jgi:hypothetical protein
MDISTIKRLISSSNTSGFCHDSKTDVRVCLASDILLCQVAKSGYRGGSGLESNHKVYLFFATTYLTELEIYFTTWALRAGNTGSEQQHRLEIMEWKGGLPINVRSGEHLQEALKSSIALIASGQWEWPGKDYTISPVDELRQSFIDAGWVDPQTVPAE